MQTNNLVEQSRHACAAEQSEHWERASVEQSKHSRLEYARRGASHGVKKLLAALDADEEPERKGLLAIVIAIGGSYIVEVERQINGESTEPGRYNHLVRNYFDALFWIDAIREIYVQPNEVQDLMLSILQSAATFFKNTIDMETAQ